MDSKETRLFRKLERFMEYNKKEHSYTFITFFMILFGVSLLGLLVGSAVNGFLIQVQGPSIVVNNETSIETRQKAFAYIALNLALLISVAYAFVHWNRHFDDWIWSSFSGMMFWLTLIASQTRLIKNFEALVKDHY